MLKKISSGAFVAFAAVLALATPPRTFAFRQSESGKTVRVGKDSRFTVTLERLGGVRGDWSWVGLPGFLKLDPQNPRIILPRRPGGLEKDVYSFEVLGAGEGTIRAERGPKGLFVLKVKAH